jgi:hypothetical protein
VRELALQLVDSVVLLPIAGAVHNNVDALLRQRASNREANAAASKKPNRSRVILIECSYLVDPVTTAFLPVSSHGQYHVCTRRGRTAQVAGRLFGLDFAVRARFGWLSLALLDFALLACPANQKAGSGAKLHSAKQAQTRKSRFSHPTCAFVPLTAAVTAIAAIDFEVISFAGPETQPLWRAA